MKTLKFFFLIIIFVFSFCLVGCNEVTTNANAIPVNDIVINKTHAYLDVGDKLILTAQVYPFNADNQNILWKSDNNNIAEVNGGIVVANSEGRTVITCISEDGELEDKCILYVSTPKLDYSKFQNNINSSKINSEIESNNSKVLQDNMEDEINKNFKTNKDFYNIIDNINKTFNELNDYFNDFFEDTKNSVEEIMQENKNFKTNQINEIDENNNSNFYFFEYKYNSNGLEDEADENTIYKDENSIVREIRR